MRDRMTPLDASMADEYELQEAMLHGDLFAEAELQDREDEQWEREQEERLLLDDLESVPPEQTDPETIDFQVGGCEECGGLTIFGWCMNADCETTDVCSTCEGVLYYGHCLTKDCENSLVE